MSKGVFYRRTGLYQFLRIFPTLKVATLPRLENEQEHKKLDNGKYTQELKTGQFMLEECEEALQSGEKEDVDLAYERICGIIKRLENTKDGIADAMLGDNKATGEVREWNKRQKEEI